MARFSGIVPATRGRSAGVAHSHIDDRSVVFWPCDRASGRMSLSDPNAVVAASMRFRGERRPVLVCDAGSDFVAAARTAEARAGAEGAALAYAFVSAEAAFAAEGIGWASLGPVPTLVRPLRLSYASPLLPRLPLLLPFGRNRRKGFREITSLPVDVRITRLWDRFSVDVGCALERTTKLFGWRIYDTAAGSRYRTFIFEDGDRYAIRAMCIFAVSSGVGYVMELLHDRSVAGMRAASHLLGLALREMSDAGAESARALALPHSGSYPIFALHAFVARPDPRSIVVRAFDRDVEDVVMLRDRWYVSYLDEMRV